MKSQRNALARPFAAVVTAFFALTVVVLGIGFAAAATIGSVNTRSLGASSNVVAACDPNGITVTYDIATPGATPNPSYSGGTGTTSTWWLRALRLTGVDSACNGKSYRMVLANASGTPLATLAAGTLTITGGNSQVLTFTATNSRLMEQLVITVFG